MSDPFHVLADGKCNSCTGKVDDNEVLNCYRCKVNFHVLCGGSNAICNKSLLILYQQKSTKKNFVWYCDSCITQLEVLETESQTSNSQKVDELEKKIDVLTDKVTSITEILTPVRSPDFPTLTDTSNTLLSNTQSNTGNAWQNSSRVMIMKNNHGPPNLEQLEQRIIGEHIDVTNSKRNMKGDVIITCPTSTAANKIKDLATELLPDHTVKDPRVNSSWINVVGFETNHSTEAVYDLLVNNNFVFGFLKGKSQCDTTAFLEVKAVKPCIKNPNVFRALVKVSNSLRQAIKRGKDKLRIGLYSCRVYDQASQIKTCNKCQRFGHWVAECSIENGKACAKCGSVLHESINCPNPNQKSCVNCTRAGIVHNYAPHTADSSTCPCFAQFRKTSYSSSNSSNGNNQQGVTRSFYPGNYATSLPYAHGSQQIQQGPHPQMLSNQYIHQHAQQGNSYSSQYLQQNVQPVHLNQ